MEAPKSLTPQPGAQLPTPEAAVEPVAAEAGAQPPAPEPGGQLPTPEAEAEPVAAGAGAQPPAPEPGAQLPTPEKAAGRPEPNYRARGSGGRSQPISAKARKWFVRVVVLPVVIAVLGTVAGELIWDRVNQWRNPAPEAWYISGREFLAFDLSVALDNDSDLIDSITNRLKELPEGDCNPAWEHPPDVLFTSDCADKVTTALSDVPSQVTDKIKRSKVQELLKRMGQVKFKATRYNSVSGMGVEVKVGVTNKGEVRVLVDRTAKLESGQKEDPSLDLNGITPLGLDAKSSMTATFAASKVGPSDWATIKKLKNYQLTLRVDNHDVSVKRLPDSF